MIVEKMTPDDQRRFARVVEASGKSEAEVEHLLISYALTLLVNEHPVELVSQYNTWLALGGPKLTGME